MCYDASKFDSIPLDGYGISTLNSTFMCDDLYHTRKPDSFRANNY